MKRLLIALLLIASIIGITLAVTESDEERLRVVLGDISTQASFVAKAPPAASIQAAVLLSNFFAEPVEIQLPDTLDRQIIVGRNEIRQKYVALRKALTSFELAFSDEDIEIDSDHADIEVTASALGTDRHGGQFFEQHRVLLILQKSSGKWMVTRAEHIENLRERADS